MTLAIRLNDIDLIKSDLLATEDKSLRRQMAFQVARQRIWLDVEEQDDEIDALVESLELDGQQQQAQDELRSDLKSLARALASSSANTGDEAEDESGV